MYSNGKTIIGHNTNDFGYKTLSKIKYFSNMSNSVIFGGHFKNMQISYKNVISQLANISFRIKHTELPLIKVSNPFPHKMPVLVNFSDIFS